MPAVLRGPLEIDQAIVLGTRDFKESDLLVSFLTKTRGKLGAVAQNAKKSTKRFGGSFERGTEIKITYTLSPGRSLAKLKEAEILQFHGLIRKSLPQMAMATTVLEIFSLVTKEGDSGAGLYDLASQTLTLLEKEANWNLYCNFQLRLLAAIGYRPKLDGCVRCGTPLPFSASEIPFSLKEGGVLCTLCEKKGTAQIYRLPTAGLRSIQTNTLSPEHASQMAHFFAGFLSYHIEKPIRSLPFLHSVMEK